MNDIPNKKEKKMSKSEEALLLANSFNFQNGGDILAEKYI